MTTRHSAPALLYGPHAPAKWLRALAATVNDASAMLCRPPGKSGALTLVPVRRTPLGQRTHRKV